MRWYIEGDDTPAIITAKGHIQSAHGNADAPTLPGICVLYELGMAMGFVQEAFDTYTLIESLPGFINNAPCIAVRGMEGVCFTHGGYGGPSAVDTLETLCALGVHTVVVVGMCGGFGQSLRVGDVVIPYRIRSEEGTSWHYVKDAEYAYPDAALHSRALAHFGGTYNVCADATVTTDAVYRQTFAKEDFWRAQGCVGVDMEASAVLTVAGVRQMRAAALLIVSDRHPLSPSDTAWAWGNAAFKETRKRFIQDTVAFATSLQAG